MPKLVRLASEDVPSIALYFDLQPIPFVSALKGSMPVVGDVSWNIQDWELAP